jgi:hypothetical protein
MQYFKIIHFLFILQQCPKRKVLQIVQNLALLRFFIAVAFPCNTLTTGNNRFGWADLKKNLMKERATYFVT